MNNMPSRQQAEQISRAVRLGPPVEVTGKEPMIGQVQQPGQVKAASASVDEQKRMACLQMAIGMQRCVNATELIEAAQTIQAYLFPTN